MKKIYLIIALVFTVGLGLGLSVNVSGEEALIPSWIKTTAGFWVDGQIGDREFIQALQFLINNDILTVEEDKTENTSEKTIPKFILQDMNYLVKLFPTFNDIDKNWKPDEIRENFHTKNNRPKHELEQGFIVTLLVNYYYGGIGADRVSVFPIEIMHFDITQFNSNENANDSFDVRYSKLYSDGINPKEFDMNGLGFDENKCVLIRTNEKIRDWENDSTLYRFDFVCHEANLLIESDMTGQIEDTPDPEFLKSMKSILGKI